VEALNIPSARLGAWIREQHLNRLVKLIEEQKYGHILKKYKTSADFMEWYEGELARFAEQLRDNLDADKEEFYRQEMGRFRALFHKPVIYADWDWESTVSDALHQAGFKDFEEQTKALEAQRRKNL